MLHGRQAGILAALGLGTMAALWTGAALLGLQVLFDVFPWAFWIMKTAGGLYLLWIAYVTWKNANGTVKSSQDVDGKRVFLHGLLINLGNPKSILFAGAVIVAIFPADISGADKVAIFLNHLAVEWILQPLLAVLLSAAPIRQRYVDAKSIFDRIAGSLMGVLGLRILLDRSSATP